MQNLKEQCDIEIVWKLLDPCNFRCSYCFRADFNKHKFMDTDTIVDGFNSLGLTCQISMTGGEPFLFPNFVELCKKLTERHVIRLATNSSREDVYRFAEEIDPSRVSSINLNIHLEERIRLNLMEDFIKKYHFLKDRGFFVTASYITHPPLLKRIASDYEFFKSRGIIIRPKLYRGTHLKYPILNHPRFSKFNSLLNHPRLRKLKKQIYRKYPEGYTKKEKAILLNLIDKSRKDRNIKVSPNAHNLGGRFVDVNLEKNLMNGVPKTKGNECTAGRKFGRMDAQGNLYSCYSDKDLYLGNLFKGEVKLLDEPIICPYETCRCPYWGAHYSKPKEV